MEEQEEIDLLPFLSKLNNHLGRIMYKVDHKIELSIDEDELIKELYICYRENNLQTLNNFNNNKTRNGKSKIKFEPGDS